MNTMLCTSFLRLDVLLEAFVMALSAMKLSLWFNVKIKQITS